MNDKDSKQYGIRITMPENDPMAMPHLLGSEWESYRWYASPEERDRALEDMVREHQFSRRGDRPSIYCEPVNP